MSVEKMQGGTLIWNADEFMMLATAETVKAVTKASIYTQGVAKEMIGGAGKGKLYRRSKQKGKRGSFTASDFHRASVPGDPPAADSGILSTTVSYMIKHKGVLVTGYVGSDIDKIRSKSPTTDPEYGIYLEMGTNRMAARPWLRPSLIKATPEIKKIFRRAMRLIK